MILWLRCLFSKHIWCWSHDAWGPTYVCARCSNLHDTYDEGPLRGVPLVPKEQLL